MWLGYRVYIGQRFDLIVTTGAVVNVSITIIIDVGNIIGVCFVARTRRQGAVVRRRGRIIANRRGAYFGQIGFDLLESVDAGVFRGLFYLIAYLFDDVRIVEYVLFDDRAVCLSNLVHASGQLFQLLRAA